MSVTMEKVEILCLCGHRYGTSIAFYTLTVNPPISVEEAYDRCPQCGHRYKKSNQCDGPRRIIRVLGVPGSPRDLTAVTYEDFRVRGIELSWLPPENEAVVGGYRIYVSPDGAVYHRIDSVMNDRFDFIDDMSLFPNEEWQDIRYYKVSAFNGEAESPCASVYMRVYHGS